MTPGPWVSDASEAEDGEVWSKEPYKIVALTGRAPVVGNAQGIARTRNSLASTAEMLSGLVAESDGWRRKAEVALKLFGETQKDVERLTAERDGMRVVVEAAERYRDRPGRDASHLDLIAAVDAWRARKAGGG